MLQDIVAKQRKRQAELIDNIFKQAIEKADKELYDEITDRYDSLQLNKLLENKDRIKVEEAGRFKYVRLDGKNILVFNNEIDYDMQNYTMTTKLNYKILV